MSARRALSEKIARPKRWK